MKCTQCTALAAEVEKLRERVNELEFGAHGVTADELRNENAWMREALVFYADTQSYEGGHANCVTGEEPVLKDGGKTARRALEENP
jgi:hypothetical protein